MITISFLEQCSQGHRQVYAEKRVGYDGAHVTLTEEGRVVNTRRYTEATRKVSVRCLRCLRKAAVQETSPRQQGIHGIALVSGTFFVNIYGLLSSATGNRDFEHHINQFLTGMSAYMNVCCEQKLW